MNGKILNTNLERAQRHAEAAQERVHAKLKRRDQKENKDAVDCLHLVGPEPAQRTLELQQRDR